VLLLGVDLKKDPEILEAAYNDRQGVTAEFNLNLLRRLNAELGTDFDLDRFTHRAFYDREAGRVEMHLVSEAAQAVHVRGVRFELADGETIWTESSYKYDLDQIAALAGDAGFALEHWWTDRRRFAVTYCVAR
jgi:uncharacterized SAM-dependent methyltransferase